MRHALTIALVIGVIALVIWWEIASWGECLESHSWWYCLRLLGK